MRKYDYLTVLINTEYKYQTYAYINNVEYYNLYNKCISNDSSYVPDDIQTCYNSLSKCHGYDIQPILMHFDNYGWEFISVIYHDATYFYEIHFRREIAKENETNTI